MTETNTSVARKIGCDPSMASMIRSGRRMPGARLLITIIKAYHLDPMTTLDAYASGPEVFGDYVRAQVYEKASA